MAEYCVTGGTGYVAAHLIKTLLERGDSVRATVRDPGNVEKVGFLWELEGAKDRLKVVKAELSEEGSFDEAIEGVDGVFHTASPVVISDYGDSFPWQEMLIDPAVKGTLNVLKSCIKARVKRVVLTSSTGAVRFRDDMERLTPLNESHWSDLDYCKRHKLWYMYAKTLAEQEAWKISKQCGLDLVVVVPSYVVGPMLPPRPTSTIRQVLNVVKGEEEIATNIIGFVHIDDVTFAHVLAMEESKASGRVLCVGTLAKWSEVAEMLKKMYPMYPYVKKFSIGLQEEGLNYDSSKISELGLPAFKTISEMFDDCIRSLQARGLL